jgi:pimeloyl-ACP methyl ester carboxylesterase
MKIDCGRVSLWLEPLRAGEGPSLLLLHELGGSSADFAHAELDWPGASYALDFCGHGRSGRVIGGTYWPEFMVANADAALAQIGPACVLGTGLGAYVALLLAGARPQLVAGAALLPGRGLAGGGPADDLTQPPRVGPAQAADASHDLQAQPHIDPLAIASLERDPRPLDYASEIAAAARRVLLIDDGGERPPWWHAVAKVPGVRSLQGDRAAALRALAG